MKNVIAVLAIEWHFCIAVSFGDVDKVVFKSIISWSFNFMYAKLVFWSLLKIIAKTEKEKSKKKDHKNRLLIAKSWLRIVLKSNCFSQYAQWQTIWGDLSCSRSRTPRIPTRVSSLDKRELWSGRSACEAFQWSRQYFFFSWKETTRFLELS